MDTHIDLGGSSKNLSNPMFPVKAFIKFETLQLCSGLVDFIELDIHPSFILEHKTDNESFDIIDIMCIICLQFEPPLDS